LIGEDFVAYSCEPKLDGIAVNLSYRDGKLEKATTRGDGKIGEDITHNIKTLNSIPLSLMDEENSKFQIYRDQRRSIYR